MEVTKTIMIQKLFSAPEKGDNICPLMSLSPSAAQHQISGIKHEESKVQMIQKVFVGPMVQDQVALLLRAHMDMDVSAVRQVSAVLRALSAVTIVPSS